MITSDVLKLKQKRDSGILIPKVPDTFGQNMITQRDALRKGIGGSNDGTGMNFMANGELGLPVYHNEIPMGKSGFVSTFDIPGEGEPTTVIDYSWRNLKEYDSIEDCLWFYVINPPEINLTTTNIEKFQFIDKEDHTRFYIIPWGIAALIFVIKGELYTDALEVGLYTP